jgi:hypothetical protein
MYQRSCSRHCHHNTPFVRWGYGNVIIPSDRLPKTGRACQRYRVKYRHKDKGSPEIEGSLGCRRMVQESIISGEKGEQGEVKIMKWILGMGE